MKTNQNINLFLLSVIVCYAGRDGEKYQLSESSYFFVFVFNSELDPHLLEILAVGSKSLLLIKVLQ